MDVSTVSVELKRLFNRMNSDKKPDKALSGILEYLNNMPVIEQEDLLGDMLFRTVQNRNIYYLHPILKHLEKLDEGSKEFLIDELNGALELMFQFGDLRRVERLVIMMEPYADQCTAEIIKKNIRHIKEKRIARELKDLYLRLERQLNNYRERLEGLQISPIITRFDHWQE